MHRLRRLHDSQYIMKNPFTNENSNLSNIFHNNIHRKKVESLKVRSTEEFLCQFAWLPCRFFRGRRQGRQPLNYNPSCLIKYYTYIYIYIGYQGPSLRGRQQPSTISSRLPTLPGPLSSEWMEWMTASAVKWRLWPAKLLAFCIFLSFESAIVCSFTFFTFVYFCHLLSVVPPFMFEAC